MIWSRSIVLALFAFSATTLRGQFVEDLAQTRLAAEQGDAEAQAKYADSIHSAFRYEEAVQCYQLAAANGLARAQRQLGQMLLTGCDPFPGRSGRVPADPVLGAKWLTQAALQQDAQAMTALGQCYEKGAGVSVNLLQAFKWYSLATEHRDLMGGIYRNQLVQRLTPDQIRAGEQLVAEARSSTKPLPTPRLVGIGLNGISASNKRRLAIINGVTFAEGERGVIKVGSQRVAITCHAIETDSVVFNLDGSNEQVRLRLSKAAETGLNSAEKSTTPTEARANPGSVVVSSSPSGHTPAPVQTPEVVSPSPDEGAGRAGPEMVQASRWPTLTWGIIGGVGLLLVVIVVRVLARRELRDAQALQRLYGRDVSEGIEASPSTASTGNESLRQWFQHRASDGSSSSCQPKPVARPAPPQQQARPDSVPIQVGELIERIRQLDWFQFEKIIGALYRQNGYAVERRGGANPDGGIDLVITRDGESIAVQCKHWKTWKVRVRTVREFVGALTHARLKRGVIVTLGDYTGEALDLAGQHSIEFVGEAELRGMLNRGNVTASSEFMEILNDTRKFCPKCEAQMTLRTTKDGISVGTNFWGCTNFPRCKYTMPFTDNPGTPAGNRTNPDYRPTFAVRRRAA